jgi:peptidylprolyl isomerase
MVSVKAGDVVYVDYVARLARDKSVFDTTSEEEAKKAGISHEGHDHGADGHKYKPLLLVAGKGQSVKGLDEAIVGCEVGQQKHVLVPADKGFGQRDASRMRLISVGEFRKRDIDPYPGLVVELDGGLTGMVKSVEAGRVKVDFNPAFAGEELEYDFTVTKCASDAKGKLELLLDGLTGLSSVAFDAASSTAKVTVDAKVRKDGDYVINKISFVSLALQYVEGCKKVVFEEEYTAE